MGVFAIILKGDEILLKERSDGKGWDLPGGGMDPLETCPLRALRREIHEEVGLNLVRVRGAVGGPLPFQVGEKIDIAQAYLCECEGYPPQTSEEAIRVGYFSQRGVRMIKLVGPEGRLGRMGRMVWDGLSIAAKPRMFLIKEQDGFVLDDTYRPSKDGAHLITTSEWPSNGIEVMEYKRLDPFERHGVMRPITD